LVSLLLRIAEPDMARDVIFGPDAARDSDVNLLALSLMLERRLLLIRFHHITAVHFVLRIGFVDCGSIALLDVCLMLMRDALSRRWEHCD
jgi:hypothetical protein